MTKATYTLLGAGGTGSILFPNLLRYLETYHRGRKEKFNLQVIDGDDVETGNLDRQGFAAPTIGQNKARALIEMRPFDPPNGNLYAIAKFLGRDNIDKLIKPYDTVLIAVDNYSVRALVEESAMELNHITVINGGNEMTDGSCQIWVRDAGENITPPLSHMHEEIVYKSKTDRAKMSCQQISKLPGGEQTIVANMMSATMMLNMLRHHHDTVFPEKGHEVHFDLQTLAMRPDDLRGVEGWQT